MRVFLLCLVFCLFFSFVFMRVTSHQSGLYEGVFALFSFLFLFSVLSL